MALDWACCNCAALGQAASHVGEAEGARSTAGVERRVRDSTRLRRAVVDGTAGTDPTRGSPDLADQGAEQRRGVALGQDNRIQRQRCPLTLGRLAHAAAAVLVDCL
ncbi:hypothetical protein ZWY2020_051100 [Hordeum vulgare]|nr:hypothetical protein ZWY2020_051100 [Hordeum vulgare]